MNKTILILMLTIVIGGTAVLVVDIFPTTVGPAEIVVEDTTEETKKVVEEEVSTEIFLKEKRIVFSDGEEAIFQIPEGFDMNVAVDGIGKARFMVMSPDGRLFVPDLVNYRLSHQGKIYIVEDFDENTSTFKKKTEYLNNLRGPNSVAFYRDKDGTDWLYVALTAELLRYRYNTGDMKPSSAPEIVTTFPNTQTPGETSVVWHITRTLKFYEDKLYIAIGSGCNSCEQLPGALRGMITRMNPDGSNVEIYAEGLRNSVGLEWAKPKGSKESLYVTGNGVDHLANAPEEMMYRVEKGKHYAWPYCYASEGVMVSDTTQKWSLDFSCEKAEQPLTTFEARSAPLGLRFFEKATPLLENFFLVALHGSFDVTTGAGYRVMRVSPEGESEIFIDGFLNKEGERVARPVDFLQRDEASFFFTDDHGGRIFYVFAE